MTIVLVSVKLLNKNGRNHIIERMGIQNYYSANNLGYTKI
jgi:hypothetical protein